MSLAADIKKAMFAAMKAKNIVEKEILRVALGEITKTGEESGDPEVLAILKKLVKSNREAISATEDAEGKAKLELEIEILQAYLPKSLGAEEIVALLADVSDQIKAAPNQGPAMGIAMKTLKAAGATAEAPDVAKAVDQIRAS
jgi:hypothetical protein